MTFHVITLFPEAVRPYLESSIVGRARQKGLVKIKYYDLLSFADNKHGRVDDRPYGGGPGMVMQALPVLRAVEAAASGGKSKKKSKVILFSPARKQFTNKTAEGFMKKYSELILVCGRYEGIDSRVKKALRDQKFQIEEISIGPYVLTGGELPAMIFIDALSRRLKGVLGRHESLEEERLGVGVPAYTRPEVLAFRGKKYKVPAVLSGGNHAKIEAWRKKHRKLTRS